MPRYRLTLAYDGGDFAGWQVQPGERTVQSVLEAAAATLFGEEIRLHPSGRTDAGVHARHQIAVFATETERDDRAVLKALNALTPSDVAVLAVDRVSDDFDPRRWARRKRYRYRWQVSAVPDPLRRRELRHLRGPFRVEEAHEALQSLVGTHDFSSFRAVGCASTHAVRTVTALNLHAVGDEVHLDVEGNGFLRHMVRIIAGCAEQVGLGRKPVGWVAAVLAAEDRAAAGPTLPAHGLCLELTEYGDGPPEWML